MTPQQIVATCVLKAVAEPCWKDPTEGQPDGLAPCGPELYDCLPTHGASNVQSERENDTNTKVRSLSEKWYNGKRSSVNSHEVLMFQLTHWFQRALQP